MAGRKISIRLGVDASDRAEVRKNFNELKTEGVSAFGAVGQSAIAAGRQADMNTEALKRVVSEAQALKSVAAQRINMSVGVQYDGPSKSARDSAMAFEAAFRSQEDGANRLRANLAAADAMARPLEAAMVRLNARLTEYRDLAKAGAITSKELAAGEALARKEFEITEAALKGRNGASKANVAARANLGRQAADVFTTGAMGMDPLMILIQQGPQVADAWSQAGIKISKGALLAAGSIGAITIAAGAALKAGYDFAKAMNEAEVTLMGLGRASGLTAQAFEAQAVAASSANDISVRSAREQQAAILNAGVSNVEVMKRIIGVSKDYAIVTGQDAISAAKKLAQAMVDPAKGAEDLTKEIGLLDYATLQSIKSMAEQGRTAEAQQALIKAVEDRTREAAENTFTWAKAIDAASASWSRFWQRVGEQTSLPFRDDAEATVRRLGALGQSGDVTKFRPQRFLTDGERAQFDAAQKALREAQAKAAQDGAKEKEKQAVTSANLTVDAILGKETKIRELANKRKALLADIAAGRIVDPGSGARDDARGQRAVAEIDKEIAKLQKPDSDKRAERLSREADAQRVNAEMGWKLVEAVSAGADAMKLAEIRRNAYTDATRKGISVEAEYQRQLAKFVADQAVAGASGLSTLEQEIKVRERANAAVASGALTRDAANDFARVELELTDLSIARDNASGREKQILTKLYDDLRLAKFRLLDVSKAEAAIDATQSNKDEIDFLEKQLSLVRLTNQERAIELARYQAGKKMERDGVTGQPAQDYIKSEVDKAKAGNVLGAAQSAAQMERGDSNQIEYLQRALELAGETDRVRDRELSKLQRRQELLDAGVVAGSAEYEVAMRNLSVIQDLTDAEARRREAQEEIRSLQEGAIDRAYGLLSKGNLNLKDWRNEALLAIQDVSNAVLKMALINPFKNWLLGTDLPTLADAKGGGALVSLLDGLFGGGGKKASGSAGFQQAGSAPSLLDVLLSNPMRGGGGIGALSGSGAVLNIAKQALQPQPVIVLPQYNFNGVTSDELLGKARMDTMNIVQKVLKGGLGKSVSQAIQLLAPGAVQQNYMDKG